MRRYFFLLIAFLCALSSTAQLNDGRYASRKTQDGTIFFLNPQKLKKTSGIKKFEYDVTLLTWTDSVTVNFTFESDLMTVPEKLRIENSSKSFACNDYKPLFIDLKKNHYEIRISAKFPLCEFEEIIKSLLPPRFVFYQEGKEETAAYSEKGWKKEHKLLNNIYSLYLYSR